LRKGIKIIKMAFSLNGTNTHFCPCVGQMYASKIFSELMVLMTFFNVDFSVQVTPAVKVSCFP
jgi:hypothetical protein